MVQWDRLTLGRTAKELGFPRDTLEKVCRLADVLKFMESDELLSEGIALKGGTAINLTIFDLPRLSVDIDLDFAQREVREYLASILVTTKEEKLFWKAFSEGSYYPDWVFGDSNEFRNVAKHPMALWKCRDKEEDKKPLEKGNARRM